MDRPPLSSAVGCQSPARQSRSPHPSPAFTWVQDGLDDVPVPPLGLHALQLLGLVALAALLLLLLSGVLWEADRAWPSAQGSIATPSLPSMEGSPSPAGSRLSFV